MTWSSTVHTTLSTDTEPSIIITFNDAKYIFNASENSCRAFLQNSNWRKARALFFTQAKVEQTSGLTGLIMSFADATIDNLSLYGPPGLTHILASSRFYTFRDCIDIQSTEIPWTVCNNQTQPCFIDSNITVYAIPALPFPVPLHHTSVSEFATDTTKPPDSGSLPLPGKRKRDSSVETPRKRLNPGTLTPGRMKLSDELLEQVKQKDIVPNTLTGSIADEFRGMIVKAMFPNSKPNPEVDAEKRREQRRKSKEGMKAKASGTVFPPPEEENPNVDVDVDSRRRSRGSLPNGFHKQLPKFSDNLPPSSHSPTLSYLVIGPQYRGKFNAEKARELGVVGPDRGRLTKGETITIQVKVGEELVERIIKPEDVLGEPERRSAILLLDVPSPAHIRSLVSSFQNSEISRSIWCGGGAPASDPAFDLRVIYHLCGDGVLEDEGYKAFMNGFCSDVQHVVASREHCPDPVTFTSAAYTQLRLNNLDEKMFPIPKYSLTPKKDLSLIPNLPLNVQPMSSGLHVCIRPYSPPIIDPEALSLDKFHPAVTSVESLILSTALKRRMSAAKANVQRRLYGKDPLPFIEGRQIGVIPLGTAGTLPSKYRNVLSTLIKIPDWGNILLDIGEGTWGQLARNFGLQEDGSYSAWQALRDLKCIFISHIHGDHHIGLAHLLAKRKLLNPPPDHPLYVVSLRAVHLYLRELSDVQDLGLFDPSGNGVISVINETLHDRAIGSYLTTGMWQVGGDEPWLDFSTSVDNGRKMCESLGLEYFKTVDVYHRCRCFGCSFKHKDGWSVTFSGDTAPTDNLVRIGMNSTVLIHEASMADNEAEIARRKAHSTIGQAISIGKKMNAKNILLTHFSGRHPKLPPSVTKEMIEAGPDAKHLVVPAFDHANMTIGDMWKMSFYISSLHLNFKESSIAEEGDDMRSRSASPEVIQPPKMEAQVARA